MNFLDRLSDYDLFAYVPQGIMALAAADYISGRHYFVLDASWDVPKGVLIFFVAYIVGHILASPSSKFVERGLVKNLMEQPSVHLLGLGRSSRFLKVMFFDYITPLTANVRNEVRNKMKIDLSNPPSGEELFWRAYTIARQDAAVRARLATFLNLYGFCRNVCFLAGIVGFTLLGQEFWTKIVIHNAIDMERLWVGIGLLFAAFFMFQRFLKFYRLYSLEVFVAYAASSVIPPSHQGNP